MEHSLKTVDAAVIGGVNMDIWGRPELKLVMGDSNPGFVSLCPGGVGRNIAHDLRYLGVEVCLVAALGGDGYAASILKSCQALGIDMSLAPIFPHRSSSTYLYVTDEKGDMRAAINDMALCSALTPELIEQRLPQLNRLGAIVLDANIPAETIAYVCQHAAPPIYADPVSAAKAGKLLPVLSRLEAIKPNRMEAEALTGESDPERAAVSLLKSGVKRVFISLGGDGMLAANAGEMLRVPCVPTEVVNTTGAGDAATAAIVWSSLQGLSLQQSLAAAVKAGAICCRGENANNQELRELLL